MSLQFYLFSFSKDKKAFNLKYSKNFNILHGEILIYMDLIITLKLTSYIYIELK